MQTQKSKITNIAVALFAYDSALVHLVEAQQPAGKFPRIGILVNGTPSSDKVMFDEFQNGLRDLGYVEGKNFRPEIRYAGEAGSSARACARASANECGRPLYQCHARDRGCQTGDQHDSDRFHRRGRPCSAGLVKSCAKPGGNITGYRFFARFGR